MAVTNRAVETSKLNRRRQTTKNCFFSGEVTTYTDNMDIVNDMFEKIAREVIRRRATS